jgi:hypothetical protein
MVNLKTCIVDTQESLESVVRTCDAMMDEDEHSKSVSVVDGYATVSLIRP